MRLKAIFKGRNENQKFVKSIGIDLTSKLGIILLIIFIVIQTILFIELSNY